MFQNSVILQFSPRSAFFRRSIQIPFSCRFTAGLFGQSKADDVGFSSSNSEAEQEASEGEMYAMLVQRLLPDGQRQLLVEKRTESANVSPGDRLEVLTDFETRLDLNLALKKCWVSQDAASTGRGAELIADGCPAPKSVVSLLRSKSNLNPSFSFTISKLHLKMKKFYLTCLIGICSSQNSFSSNGGNINQVCNTIKIFTSVLKDYF